jgi:hypothetical protein
MVQGYAPEINKNLIDIFYVKQKASQTFALI